MSRLEIPLAVALSLLCMGQGRDQQARVRPKRIPIRMYAFSIEAPDGWRAGIGKDVLPMFVNFPWSKMQAQLRLPAGDATINVVSWTSLVRRKGDELLTGWARLDAARAASGSVNSSVLVTPPSTGISEAILMSFDEATFGPDDQAQRDVSVYWTYQRENFAAHLSYVLGDPKGGQYENTLRQIVFSVRPLE